MRKEEEKYVAHTSLVCFNITVTTSVPVYLTLQINTHKQSAKHPSKKVKMYPFKFFCSWLPQVLQILQQYCKHKALKLEDTAVVVY